MRLSDFLNNFAGHFLCQTNKVRIRISHQISSSGDLAEFFEPFGRTLTEKKQGSVFPFTSTHCGLRKNAENSKRP